MTNRNKSENFEDLLLGKFLDPIHGVIRITKLEKKIIDHPLFQRLRDIRQNTFLYKVFPSAMHSRFEHSVGVMHLSYEILKNIDLNALIYNRKNVDADLYLDIKKIPISLIQELRIAALLHDVGHGPLAHQFDSFALEINKFREKCEAEGTQKYDKIISLADSNEKRLSHEQVSCIFIKEIIDELKSKAEDESESDDAYKENIRMISADSIIKIVEKKYEFKNEMEGPDIYPLLGSIISSSPIDADRMDYLLRDSYFSGVKYGIYDYGRLLMSFIPVKVENSIYLAYKESGMDSILEFANARSGLYSQVYFHKTNRALSAMLNKACSGQVSANVISLDSEDRVIKLMKDFYINNPDKKFLEYTLENKLNEDSKKILHDVINRDVWKKIYEKKHTFSNVKLSDNTFKEYKNKISENINCIVGSYLSGNGWVLDFQIEDNFKDIEVSQAKIIKKEINGKYKIKELRECNEALQPYHYVKFFIRIFASKATQDANVEVFGQLIEKIEKFIENEIDAIEAEKAQV
ncbi:HD domain-containing protein [Enterobacter bugandensis]|uniref:HD domain-containing protein n=1 Tax=Enterobacter bugandensis TaxID=881260 RepID=UPI0010A60BD6|nr:HD domain-containing protein [Enterobacter bugandensis]MCK6895831.1 HD domain-containing protein [Enterobacter bugandensis]QCE24815.1 HD domain-containing protein [Enterobacter bugandensis]